jgi:hypothetical protein
MRGAQEEFKKNLVNVPAHSGNDLNAVVPEHLMPSHYDACINGHDEDAIGAVDPGRDPGTKYRYGECTGQACLCAGTEGTRTAMAIRRPLPRQMSNVLLCRPALIV